MEGIHSIIHSVSSKRLEKPDLVNYFPPVAIEEELVDKVQNSYMLQSSIHLYGGDSFNNPFGIL